MSIFQLLYDYWNLLKHSNEFYSFNFHLCIWTEFSNQKFFTYYIGFLKKVIRFSNYRCFSIFQLGSNKEWNIKVVYKFWFSYRLVGELFNLCLSEKPGVKKNVRVNQWPLLSDHKFVSVFMTTNTFSDLRIRPFIRIQLNNYVPI